MADETEINDLEFIELWSDPTDFSNLQDYMLKIHSDIVMNKRSSAVIITRHNPIMTCGLADKEYDANKFILATRGGGLTYHDPGQIITYPILRLRDFDIDAADYTQMLQTWIYDILKSLEFEPILMQGQTGVWIPDGKVAFIGVRIKNGVTMHGFALNLTTHLDPFKQFAVCSIGNIKVANLNQDHRRVAGCIKRKISLEIDRLIY